MRRKITQNSGRKRLPNGMVKYGEPNGMIKYGESQDGAQTATLAGMNSRVTAAVLRVPAYIDVSGNLQDRKVRLKIISEKVD